MKSIGSIFSTIIGALIASRWISINVNAPLYICSIGGLISAPFVALMIFSKVFLSSLLLFLKDRLTKKKKKTFSSGEKALTLSLISLCMVCLFGEVWVGTIFYVVQAQFPSRMLGTSYSLLIFVIWIVGYSSTAICNYFIDFLCETGCETSYKNSILAIWMIVSYFGSSALFSYSSKTYMDDLLIKTQAEKGDQVHLVTRSQINFSIFVFIAIAVWLILSVLLSVLNFIKT